MGSVSKKDFLFFIVIGIAIFLGLEFISKPVFKHVTYEEELNEQFNDFYRCKDSVEILALGCSHMNYGFAADSMKDYIAFNMAFRGQDAYYDYSILKRFVDSMPNMRIVILNLSPFSFGYNQYKSDKLSAMCYINHGFLPPENKLWSVMENKFNILKYQNEFIMRIISYYMGKRESHKDYHISPYGWMVNNNTEDEKAFEKNGKRYASIQEGRNIYIDWYKKYFEKTIDLAIEKNKTVFVVTVPYTNYYWKYFSDDYKNKFLLYRDYLMKKYPNVHFLYYSPGILPDSLYFDSQHLNKKGAIYFTNMLMEDIRRELSE